MEKIHEAQTGRPESLELTPAQALELAAALLGSKAQVERLHDENNLFSHPDFERIQVEAREAAARFYALNPATLRAQAAALAEREALLERLEGLAEDWAKLDNSPVVDSWDRGYNAAVSGCCTELRAALAQVDAHPAPKSHLVK